MTENRIRPGDDVLVVFYTSSDPDAPPLLEVALPADQALGIVGRLMAMLTDRRRAAEQPPAKPKPKSPRLVVVR